MNSDIREIGESNENAETNKYDLVNDSNLWFKYKNNFLKLYNGKAALILSIINGIPMEGFSGTMVFGADAFIVNQDYNPNKKVISRISIEESLSMETELFSDTDIFSMIKFQKPYTEIPSTKTIAILLQNRADEAKKAKEAKEATEVETFKVQYKKFEVTIRVDKNGEVDGWFEHDIYGDEVGGSLTFERTENGIELTDFDGVMILPIEVGQVIAKLGYVIDLEHFCS